MRILKSDDMTIYTSPEIVGEYTAHLKELEEEENGNTKLNCLLSENILNMLGRHLGDKFLNYIYRFAAEKKLRTFGVLVAHGHADSGSWLYADGNQEFPVQDWLARHDGKYACLFCNVCNPGSCNAKTQSSLLIIPDETLSGWRLCFDACHLSLIHPTRGEIDDYTIDYELKSLSPPSFSH